MKTSKTVFALFAIVGLASGVASAAPIATTGTPASAYVSKGLVAHWDGIENAGPKLHDAAATAWVNLSTGASDATLPDGKFTVTDNSIVLSKAQAIAEGITCARSTTPITIQASVRAKSGTPSGDCWFFLDVQSRGGFGHDKRNGYGYSYYQPTSSSWGSHQTIWKWWGNFNYASRAYVRHTVSAVVPVSTVEDGRAGKVYQEDSLQSYKAKWNNTATHAAPNGQVKMGYSAMDYEFFGVRIYDRELSVTEIAINANIDKMRYEGADPGSLTWPEGWRVRADGVWEVKVSFSAAAGGSVSVTEAWVAVGSTTTVTATPEAGKFVIWTGDTATIRNEGHDVFANCITVRPETPTTLTATFSDLASSKPTDFSAEGVTGTFADRVLTIDVAKDKTCTYDYASTLASGWVTNIVKTGAGSITPAVASAYLGSFDFQEGSVTLNAAGQLGANNVGIVRKASGATINSSRTVTTGKKIYLAGTVNHNSWDTFVSSCDIELTGNLTMSSVGKAKNVVVATGSQLDMNGCNLTVNTDQMLIAQLNGMTITNSNDSVASVISVHNKTKVAVTDGTSFWGGSRNQLKTSDDYGNQGFTCSGTVGGDWTILSCGANFQAGSGSSANTLANKIDCAVIVSRPTQYGYTTKYNYLTTDSCLTFGGPLTGTSTMDVRGGTLNFLNAANTYSGALSLTDATSSKIRPCIYVWNGANFSAGSVTLNNADIWMDDNTAFAFPAITLGNGTKAANCCTITGGPTGDKACGRATIAGFTKSGGLTLTVDSPVHITGTTLVSTNTLALGSGTTANELPVFDHLSFANGTTFDMNGKNLTIGNLTGIPTVTNPGTLTITGNWTVSGDALVDGGKLNLGAGALAFGPSATITITKGTKKIPSSVTIACAAGGITGSPTAGAGGMNRVFMVSQSGTELQANARGLVIVVK